MLSIKFMYLLCPFLALYEPDDMNRNYNLDWQRNEGGAGRRNHILIIDGVNQTISVENE